MPVKLKESHDRWRKFVDEAFREGWVCVGMWEFMSPKGTIHDLSAADPSRLRMVEENNLFLVKGKNDQ